MNLLADESVDVPIIEALRSRGYDIVAIIEVSPGASDDVVLERAARERRILLTADKDFGELIYRLGRISSGIVLLRLSGVSSPNRSEIVVSAFAAHASEIPGAFTVIEPARIRVRKQ